ncbi:hypothetical protein QCI77_14615 [Bacillus cereus group sp. MG9]|uniref:hypothetical protein n=1 Tax=Bacillus cereus group sp. MG9 TaxID=3040247 RepID=UPI003394B323
MILIYLCHVLAVAAFIAAAALGHTEQNCTKSKHAIKKRKRKRKRKRKQKRKQITGKRKRDNENNT